jgi:hypothetical protein
MRKIYSLLVMSMIVMASFAQTFTDVVISPTSGDITAALNNYLNGKTARNITINLAAGGSYTLSNPIMPGGNLIINGAEGAVIDASNLTSVPNGKKSDEEKGTNSFILMSDKPGISQTSGYYRVDQVTIKDLTIKGLKNGLFSDHEQKYCIVNFTIDNVVLQAEAGSKQDALIAFKKGGYKDFTIKNSTVYGNNSNNSKCFTLTKADLSAMGYDATKSRHYVTYLNNTFVNLLPTSSAETWAQEAFNGVAYVTYDIQNNIWYGCGLDIAIGLVGKDMVPEAKANFSQNTYYNPDEKSTDMKDQAPLESVTDNSNDIMTTNPTFADIEKGDFHLHPGSLQARYKTGDPRWLVAYKASQALPADIVMNLHKAENISDVLDAAIKKVDKLGDIYITLAPNAKYILTNTIKSPGSVTIIGEGTMVNCTRLNGPMIVLEGTDSLANTVDKDGVINGKSKKYKHVETVNVTGITATLKNTSTFFRETQKTLVDNFIISNCVFELDGSDCLLDFAGYPANLEITESTFWSEKGHTGHLLHASGRVKDLDPNMNTLQQSMIVDHCTLYRISQGQDLNHLTSMGSRTLIMTLTNSILYNCAKDGEEVKGWLGGAATDGPTVTYGYNTYWSNGQVQAGWIDDDETVDGTDLTGTAYKADPGFFDVVSGDFAIATMSPQAKDSETSIQNGDPRWSTWAAGDYYIRTTYNSDHGDVVTNKSYANQGAVITVSALPADGYELASVAVIDEQGNEIPLTNETLVRRRAPGDDDGVEDTEDIEDDIVITSFTMPDNSVSIAVTFKESATAIKNVTTTPLQQDGKWYSMSGIPVKTPGKGVYIYNGKKVVIK